ncbi:MAG: hypothetical protein P8J65_05915 [Candidatus Actinomarina sp.]|nr:hypothetical protein [Candidatus Actinomarina sp.]
MEMQIQMQNAPAVDLQLAVTANVVEREQADAAAALISRPCLKSSTPTRTVKSTRTNAKLCVSPCENDLVAAAEAAEDLAAHVAEAADEVVQQAAADEEVEERARLKAPDAHHALPVAVANNLLRPHSVTSARKPLMNSWNELGIRAWKSTKNR